MSWIGVGAVLVNTAFQYDQGRRQAKAADAANRAQAEAMANAERQQEQNYNRQNRNRADVGSLLQQNTGGFGGANLTGGSAGLGTGTLGGGGMLGR